MKKLLLSGAAAFAAVAAMSQTTSLTGRANNTSTLARGTATVVELPSVFSPEAQMLNPDKAGPSTFYISYADYNTSDAVAGTLSGGRYVINPGAPAIDSALTTISVGLNPYVGFTDMNDVGGTYFEADPAAPNAKLRIDSVSILMGHSNGSGTPNRLFTTLTGAQSVTFGGGIGALYVPNNTVFWRDSIVTSTSLSPSGSAFGANSSYVWDMAPGSIHSLSATNHICVKFDAVIGTDDTVAVSGYYKANGGTPVTPLIYNSFGRSSEAPTSIFVFPINWAITTKVTYTSSAGLTQLESNGFTIHSFMPNPAGESTTLRYEVKSPADVTFIVTDMTGKQVEQIRLAGQTAGTFNHELNTSGYAAGLYNVSMTVNKQVYTQKLSVVK